MEAPGPTISPTTVRAAANAVPPGAGAGTIVSISRIALATSLAGDGTRGYVNALGPFARFNSPAGNACDRDGNVYVVESINNVIRKIDRTGLVTTYAGSGAQGHNDGPAATATFAYPQDIAIDRVSGTMYVADTYNNCIRQISPGGTVSTLAGGIQGDAEGWGTSAKFWTPTSLAIDAGNNIYVADEGNNCIKKVTGVGFVTKLAGGTRNTSGYVDGTGANARFSGPYTITAGPDGLVYVTDFNRAIRRIDYTGNTSTLARSETALGLTVGLVMDSTNTLFIADNPTHNVYTLSPNGKFSLLAGNGTSGFAIGIGALAQFREPWGAALDDFENLYISDYDDCRIRKLEMTSFGKVSTLAGNGTQGVVNGAATAAEFYNPSAIAADAAGNTYVADANNHLIRKITPAGIVSTLAGSIKGFQDGTGAGAKFNTPTGLTVDAQGNLYVADCNNHRIRKITPSGVVTTVAGQTTRGSKDGPAAQALFDYPLGIAADANGNLFIAGGNENRIREISVGGQVSTIAGTGVAGNADGGAGVAQFRVPAALSIRKDGSIMVADRDNHRIRWVSLNGQVSTFAGSTPGFLNAQGRSAQFNSPTGIVVDAAGMVYVADRGNNRIRKISPRGVVYTQAGSGNGTYSDDDGYFAGFKLPFGIAMDKDGRLLIADWGNNRIRVIQ
jgi:sugar lactone lactonase YvrE